MFKRDNFTKDFNKKWDDYILKLNNYSPYHRSWLLNFHLKSNKSTNSSFVFLDGKKCLAVVPLAIYKNTLSFGGRHCPSPIVNLELKESLRRKIFKEIFITIEELMKKNNLKEYYFSRQTFQNKNSNNEMTLENLFELMSFANDIHIYNNLIIDLSKSKKSLESNLSKYHRKNIKKSQNKINVEIVDHNLDDNTLNKYFSEFRELHIKSAGRETRPIETWNIMKDCIEKENANLFIAKNKIKNISFLFCGKYDVFSFGWTQVNDGDFEKDFMPRHFLEWSAILYYKKIGLRYYNLGERFHSNSDGNISEKELNISYFKEKYGSGVFPKVHYIKRL